MNRFQQFLSLSDYAQCRFLLAQRIAGHKKNGKGWLLPQARWQQVDLLIADCCNKLERSASRQSSNQHAGTNISACCPWMNLDGADESSHPQVRCAHYLQSFFSLYILTKISSFSSVEFKEHAGSIQLSSFQEQQVAFLNKSQSLPHL